MKLNQIASSFIVCGYLLGCTQPIANSLLVDFKSTCSPTDTSCQDSAAAETGGLDIQAVASTISAPIEGSDVVEITGSCKDLGRKNNRILVEVYAGEDESVDPYINNTFSDTCYPSTNSVRSGLESVMISPKALLIGPSQAFTFTANSGVPPYTYAIVLGGGAIIAGTGAYTSSATDGTDIIEVTDGNNETSRSIVTVRTGVTTAVSTVDSKKCFSVTRGIGLIEDAGLPTQRSYPQCHNGQFGFSVRLGRVLPNAVAGQANYKYLVRYKLRTQDGTIADSVWGRVTIDRALTAPTISSVTRVHEAQKCTIKGAPARFNPGILYTLSRTFTDILQTNAGATNLYTNANTFSTTAGTSLFEWDDVGLVDGVTYNYTLTSTEANYSYTPTPPTASSVTVTCTTKTINVMLTATPVSGTCYLGLKSGSNAVDENTTFNPYVTYEWGYSSTNSGWTGADGKANSGYVVSTCGNTAVCTQAGLPVGANYYFALRAKNLVTGEIGRWSPVVACPVTN